MLVLVLVSVVLHMFMLVFECGNSDDILMIFRIRKFVSLPREGRCMISSGLSELINHKTVSEHIHSNYLNLKLPKLKV